jgi:hypothetical protein
MKAMNGFLRMYWKQSGMVWCGGSTGAVLYEKEKSVVVWYLGSG